MRDTLLALFENQLGWGIAMARSPRLDERPNASFRQMIRSAALRRDARPIPTSSPEQASIIIETFFATASSAVRIVTAGLNARIYGSEGVLVEAKKFLASSDHRLEVIFLKPHPAAIWHTHPLLRMASENRNVYAGYVQEYITTTLSFHFSVVDNDIYRFKSDSNGHSSIVSFGDKELAKTLIDIFHRLRSVSIEIKELLAA